MPWRDAHITMSGEVATERTVVMPTSLDSQIAAGVRTVLDLHQHMHGLRENAEQRFQQFATADRDYLTPSEDERVRQLLVSYWHARNALLGTVADFRGFAADERQVESPQRDQVFLVGFTAALILVDAARFLRDICLPNPVIAAKLNEPEPHFGIPAGVYNIIQKNLTSLSNAWGLYQANKHFQKSRDLLAACATGDTSLQAVLELAQRLSACVQVSKSQYAKAKLHVRARQVSRALTQHSFGKAASWVIEMSSRAIGKIGVKPGHRPALPEDIRAALAPLLEPGDVIITRKQYAATNYFLPGFWPHAILYLGELEELAELGLHEHENMKPRWQRLQALDAGEPRRVLEAMADGVHLRSMLSAHSVDGAAVIRTRLPLPQRLEAIGRGLFHEGKPYDFDFDFTRSSRLVCTEVVYRSYEGIGGLEFPLTPRVGRLTLAAEDLLRMALDQCGFELVATYLPGAPAISTGEAAERDLRNTIGRKSVD